MDEDRRERTAEAQESARRSLEACGRYLAEHAADIVPSNPDEATLQGSFRVEVCIDPGVSAPTIRTSRGIIVVDR